MLYLSFAFVIMSGLLGFYHGKQQIETYKPQTIKTSEKVKQTCANYELDKMLKDPFYKEVWAEEFKNPKMFLFVFGTVNNEKIKKYYYYGSSNVERDNDCRRYHFIKLDGLDLEILKLRGFKKLKGD